MLCSFGELHFGIVEARISQWCDIFTGGWDKEGLYYDIIKKIFNVH